MNRLLMIVIFILFASLLNANEISKDDICQIIPNVLCVKDILNDIEKATKIINQTTYDIEKNITNKIKTSNTLNNYIQYEMDLIYSHLPTLQYHKQLSKINNIDKKYLVQLFSEAHDAMIFYYYSIDDILDMNGVFSFLTDFRFKQIQFDLRNEIICKYRSILHVYSYDWSSIYPVNRIKFSTAIYQTAPSIVHDIHSVTIVRLLRQWMQAIHSDIIILDKKFV